VASVWALTDGSLSAISHLDYAIEAALGGAERPEQRRDSEVGFQPVHVGSSDVEGLVVSMVKAVEVTGRCVLDDPAIPLSRLQGSGLMIRARLVGDELPGTGSTRFGHAGDDRVFQLTSMFGRRMLEFANVPRGWYVKAVRYGGKDIIDTATEFKAGSDPSALEVVLSMRGAVVTGRVLDESGNAARGARVLILRTDSVRRTPFDMTTVTVSSDGAFRTGPQRAGEYLILALGPDVTPPPPDDRDRLAALAERAERITLAADEERTLDLTVTKQR
jgi:hypothetical protein